MKPEEIDIVQLSVDAGLSLTDPLINKPYRVLVRSFIMDIFNVCFTGTGNSDGKPKLLQVGQLEGVRIADDPASSSLAVDFFMSEDKQVKTTLSLSVHKALPYPANLTAKLVYKDRDLLKELDTLPISIVKIIFNHIAPFAIDLQLTYTDSLELVEF